MSTPTQIQTSSPSPAEQVREVFLDCLYESTPPTVPPNAVLVQGFVQNFGFDPLKVDKNRNKIAALVQELVAEEFYEGMSALRLPFDRNGNQWGEHQNAEQLYAIAAAIGVASMPLSKAYWALLPGSVPYVLFQRPHQTP